jgi:hypothetical protein
MDTDTKSERGSNRISDRDNNVPSYEEIIDEGAADAAQQKQGGVEAREYLRGRSQEQFHYRVRQFGRCFHLIETYGREGPDLKNDAKKIGLSLKNARLFAKLHRILDDIGAEVEKGRRAKGTQFAYPTLGMMESWLPGHAEKVIPLPRGVLEKQVAFLKDENADLKAEVIVLKKLKGVFINCDECENRDDCGAGNRCKKHDDDEADDEVSDDDQTDQQAFRTAMTWAHDHLQGRARDGLLIPRDFIDIYEPILLKFPSFVGEFFAFVRAFALISVGKPPEYFPRGLRPVFWDGTVAALYDYRHDTTWRLFNYEPHAGAVETPDQFEAKYLNAMMEHIRDNSSCSVVKRHLHPIFLESYEATDHDMSMRWLDMHDLKYLCDSEIGPTETEFENYEEMYRLIWWTKTEILYSDEGLQWYIVRRKKKQTATLRSPRRIAQTPLGEDAEGHEAFVSETKRDHDIYMKRKGGTTLKELSTEYRLIGAKIKAVIAEQVRRNGPIKPDKAPKPAVWPTIRGAGHLQKLMTPAFEKLRDNDGYNAKDIVATYEPLWKMCPEEWQVDFLSETAYLRQVSASEDHKPVDCPGHLQWWSQDEYVTIREGYARPRSRPSYKHICD